MRLVFTLLVGALLASAGCSRARTYELHGQVLSVDRTRMKITIKHEDIRGFMPGMTMAFKVRDLRPPALPMDILAPGDSVPDAASA